MFLCYQSPDVAHGHPYALHRRSPLVGMGVNGDWAATDKDLAGNLRLNDIVDIGCYENWDKMSGFVISVK